ncbi:hypothetical protein [Pseudodesulfovibrio sediminis]|uniref:Uncharacterized protein n=1 Tax=Pseudodesulfovibrio sediminis TaxID=2810563 RepID=A0ABM7P5V5_9BACT|nr:hypothetical protein [Pseudodesulfovibrio sediminis]BCS88311.1 hypothetical protein PSDVSF_15530 [Pseudodesulfovibrio sediminis]
MRHFNIIALIGTLVLFLTVAPGLAGNKFKNEDTAKNRQDNVFGTEQDETTGTTTLEKNEQGDTILKHKGAEKEEVDWYEKMDGTLGKQLDINVDSNDYHTP